MSDHNLAMKTAKLSECEETWGKIFPCTPNRSPFLSYEWFSALARHLQKKDPEVLLFFAEDEPVAILPATGEQGRIGFIADERVTDLCDMLYVAGYAKAATEEFCSQVAASGWHMDLFPVGHRSPLLEHLPRIMRQAKTDNADLSPYLPLPGSWEEYLEGLTGKHRHELRRKLRKAERVILKDAAPEQTGLLFDLMAVSSDEKREFLSDRMRDFFAGFIRAFAKRGWLRYRIAFSGDDAIGAILSFYQDGCVYLYNTGFDPSYAALSPGIVTIALDIRSSIQAGDRCYDFLRGAERFKFNLGARERFTKRIQC